MVIQDYSGSMSSNPPTQETVKKATAVMKEHWEITAHTGYCGEELVGYYAVSSKDELYPKADDLMAECAAEWAPNFEDYETAGYESPEDYEEAYLSDCGCTYRRITKAEYEAAIKEGF